MIIISYYYKKQTKELRTYMHNNILKSLAILAVRTEKVNHV